MKKILLLLVICLSFALQAQDSKEIYGRLNYAFVPHNMLQGVGYSVGYHWQADKPLSYKVELGMLTTYREREIDQTIGNIQFLNLYYNLAQMHVAIIPTWQFVTTYRWGLSAGLGLSGAYQSKLFTVSNYKYRERPTSDYWQQVTDVDAASNLRAGLVGAFDIHYQLSAKWVLGLTAQYQIYYQGESVLEVGIGAGYRF
ncbi:MAG: hypothetical protein Q7J05_06775 [Paludibacter sp.]|nr:hypothetical protein [Paludibacter sp.]